MLKNFLRTALVLLGFLPVEILTAATAGKPNFVFILTDDQRFDAMGCAGIA